MLSSPLKKYKKMKKLLTLIIMIMLSHLGYSQVTCQPMSLGGPGLQPAPDNVPCIIRGQAYNETVFFQNYTSFAATISGISIQVDVNSTTIDSITNLPCGISWAASKLTFAPSETGCIEIFGTSLENLGQYPLNIYMTFSLTFTDPIFGQSVTETVSGDLPSLIQQASGLGISFPISDVFYVSRVIDALPCPARDMNANDFSSGPTCPCAAPPAPVISGATNVITLQTETYSVTPQTGYTYAWNVQGGSIASGQSTPSITVDWGAIGSGSVMLTWTEPGGCPNSATVPVTIGCNPPVAPTITGSTTPALQQFETYTAPVQAGFGYQWSVTGGSVISGQGSASVIVNWSTAGAGSIMLTWTDGSGCSNNTTLNVNIGGSPCTPPAAPVITGPTAVNEQQSESYSAPSKSGFNYTWSVSGGSIASGAGTNSITVDWSAIGTATVSLTWDSAGCSSSASLTVNITCAPASAPTITGETNVSAQPETYSAPVQSGYTYDWTITGGTISAGQDSNVVTVTWSGDGSLSLTWTDPSGCSNQTTITVTFSTGIINLTNKINDL